MNINTTDLFLFANDFGVSIMHIKLNNTSKLFLAFELKRVKLGYSTTTAAIRKAMELFLSLDEPTYLNDCRKEDELD